MNLLNENRVVAKNSKLQISLWENGSLNQRHACPALAGIAIPDHEFSPHFPEAIAVEQNTHTSLSVAPRKIIYR